MSAATNPQQVEVGLLVLEAVCQVYAIDGAQLTGPGRIPELVEARRVAVGLMTEAGLSTLLQGTLLRRSHSVVHYHQVCLGLVASSESHVQRTTATWEERYCLGECRKLLGWPATERRAS